MGFRKKVKALIKDDRPAKLKSFLSSHDTDPSEITFSRKRNLLHYCAEFGSADMLRCLLRLECDPMLQDRDGRLPLHTTLYRCLSLDSIRANEIYQDMVCLLLKVCPLSQDIEDKDYVTCHDLLTKLKKRLPSGHQGDKNSSGSRTEEEIEWQRKLANESQFEFEEQVPHHEYIEDYPDNEGQESFASWSNRLYQEYQEKKYGQALSSNPRKRRGYSPKDSPTKKSKSTSDPDEDLKKAREEMRKNYKPPPPSVPSPSIKTDPSQQLLCQKARYEKRFTSFFNHPPAVKSVTFAGIPWPCTNVLKLTDTLFCNLPDKDSLDYKKFLRRERVRWHPDKFMQKFREFLHPNHVDKIMGRVKVISQTLNALAS